jgi:hypothetical protein
MSTSKHSFEQVKGILGKLDRFIDAARARRLDTHPSAGTNGDARSEHRDAPGQRAEPLPAIDPASLQARPLRPAQPFGAAPATFAVRPEARRA